MRRWGNKITEYRRLTSLLYIREDSREGNSGGSRGEARGGRASPLFVDQTEARRAEKMFLRRPLPRPSPLILVSGRSQEKFRFGTTTTWKCLISRFMEDVNKQRRPIFSLFLSLDMVPWNSASGRFAYIWQSKRVWIISIRTEKKRKFTFKATFSLPSRRWILIVLTVVRAFKYDLFSLSWVFSLSGMG